MDAGMTIGTEEHEIEETAKRMLARYSSSKVATEMALFHACDYHEGSAQYKRWRAVADKIKELARGAA